MALFLAVPLPSYAAIQGTDLVGSTTVSDRGLTITEAPTVECKYGVLCDKDGTVLWSRDMDEHSAMASTTKMMTAIVALENGDLNATYTISAAAAAVGESSMELSAGMQVSLHDLLCGLLVKSGNDAGVAIAEAVAGSEEKFAIMMNEKAAAMGLSNTHFTNPHGLDADNHYSSAYDLSVIARYAMHNETFRTIVGKKKVKLKLGGKNYTFKSTNSLLNTWDDCIGIKTGYTLGAGYCLASAAQRDGIELYAVVLGCENEAERFTDSYRLLDWGFKHYRSFELASADQTLAKVPLSGYPDRTVKAGVAQDTSALALDYDGDISVDVGGGVKVTTVTVTVLAIWSYMRGRDDLNVFGRRVEGTTVRRAVLTTVFYFLVAVFSVLLIELIQELPLPDVLMEVFSALGTVGLSTGLTRELNSLSRVVIMILMYSGRVGSLTVLLSVSERKPRVRLRNPAEKIIVS